MQLKYDTYDFPANGVNISTSGSRELADDGTLVSETYIFSLDGTLIADQGLTTAQAQAQIKEKTLALEAALRVQNRNLILYLDDGSESALLLKSAGAVGGVRVTTPVLYPTTENAELGTFRRFTVQLQATYGAGVKPDGSGGPENPDNIALSFQESLSFSGFGRPRRIFHEDINGLEPLPEIVVPRTTYKAVQSGRAVGFLGYPSFPPEIFPQDPGPDFEQNFEGSADGQRDWTISWRYSFESGRPLIGLPHYWVSGGLRRG